MVLDSSHTDAYIIPLHRNIKTFQQMWKREYRISRLNCAVDLYFYMAEGDLIRLWDVFIRNNTFYTRATLVI